MCAVIFFFVYIIDRKGPSVEYEANKHLHNILSSFCGISHEIAFLVNIFSQGIELSPEVFWPNCFTYASIELFTLLLVIKAVEALYLFSFLSNNSSSFLVIILQVIPDPVNSRNCVWDTY